MCKNRITFHTIGFASAVLLLSVLCSASSEQTIGTVPAILVSPVLDDKGQVLEQNTEAGHSYPVFRLADDNPLTRSAKNILANSFAQSFD